MTRDDYQPRRTLALRPENWPEFDDELDVPAPRDLGVQLRSWDQLPDGE